MDVKCLVSKELTETKVSSLTAFCGMTTTVSLKARTRPLGGTFSSIILSSAFGLETAAKYTIRKKKRKILNI